MATRPRHPNKEIEAAVRHAEKHGWIWQLAPGHAWGRLQCPSGRRDGCRVWVYSTPSFPEGHAKDIRKEVDRCRHGAN